MKKHFFYLTYLNQAKTKFALLYQPAPDTRLTTVYPNGTGETERANAEKLGMLRAPKSEPRYYFKVNNAETLKVQLTQVVSHLKYNNGDSMKGEIHLCLIDNSGMQPNYLWEPFIVE